MRGIFSKEISIIGSGGDSLEKDEAIEKSIYGEAGKQRKMLLY